MACKASSVVVPFYYVKPETSASRISCISTLPTAGKGVGFKSQSLQRRSHASIGVIRAMSVSETKVMEKMGVQIERNPAEVRLSELKVRSWPKWGCPPSKFPWTYTARETCYLLEGRVKVYPDGYNDYVEIGPGDLVVFPKGMKCTWDVSEAVDKHYTFDD
uniref:(S)-ureidoglycine aminohydrolase cupin domain-containing protein n=1 Tax=Araucaria cunninghamii TaxID=56994 RepID=A0A0D6R9T8_ARACU